VKPDIPNGLASNPAYKKEDIKYDSDSIENQED